MPEHLHTGRCILVAAVALLWAAAAQAAPKDGPGKDSSAEDASPAISLNQLGGTWKNAKSGVNVRIEQSAAGWEVWFSTTGEARITLPEKNRPAIKIDGRNFTCSYSVTLPSAQTMAQCPTGVFTRLEPAPSVAKPAASAAPQAKPAAKIEPAPVKRPPEVKQPSQAASVTAPAPSIHARPLWAPSRMAPRHAVVHRRPPVRFAFRHRFRRFVTARPYRARGYRSYRYFRYRYRWYVILVPRCGCR